MKFMKKLAVVGMACIALITSACTRVETGEVGVRVNFDKTISPTELLPGSMNQVIFGSVKHFPVKDNQVNITGLTPLAADNSTIKDFDMTVVYSLNPSSVAELYTKKSRGFHITDDSGDTFLMYNYIHQLARNAAYKVARSYPSLAMNDNRSEIERRIELEVKEQLEAEKLGSDITLSQVLVRQITPDDRITESANKLVEAQNLTKRKEEEVRTADLEAQRIAKLNANSGATRYMEATALVTIAEAVRDGAVKTIIIPYDFKGIVNAN